jgi:hypothetical protein
MELAQRALALGAAIAAAAAVISCGAGEAERDEVELCGVTAPRAEVEAALSHEVAASRGDSGVWSSGPNEHGGCRVHFPDGASLGFGVMSTGDAVAEVARAGVALGGVAEGAVERRWLGEQTRPLRGYVTFACETGEGGAAEPVTLVADGRAEGDEPSYRQLAAAFVVVANGYREHHGCGGDPYALPVDLPDGPPEHTLIQELAQVCDTFPEDELSAVLRGDDGRTDWYEWKSPGGASPVTTCHVWRERGSEEPESYVFGPMVSFSRVSGPASDGYEFADGAFGDGVEEWSTSLAAEAYVNESDYRLKVDCGGGDLTFIGRFAANTVDRADFEDLFQKWVRAQAERDGCSVDGE